MATSSTPAARYKWRPSPKQLKESYEVRLAAQFGGKREKERLAKYNKRIKERKVEVSNEAYEVDGRRFTRYQVMDYIVTMVSSGMSLPEVCEIQGVPSMLTIYTWKDNHPEFVKALLRAEEVRGHLLGEKALSIALNTDRENVAADKLKVDTLAKAAARTNRAFQDKQVVESQDEFSQMTADQIKARISAMVAANPELQKLLPASLGPTSPRTDQPSLTYDAQTLDPVEIETQEPADN